MDRIKKDILDNILPPDFWTREIFFVSSSQVFFDALAQNVISPDPLLLQQDKKLVIREIHLTVTDVKKAVR